MMDDAKMTYFSLVPTRPRGNAVGNAPAWRERDAGAEAPHSLAGAWERDIYRIIAVYLWLISKTISCYDFTFYYPLSIIHYPLSTI